MRVLRGIELAAAMAAGAVFVLRAVPLFGEPIYCYADSEGGHGCYGLLDPASSAVFYALVLLAAVMAAGIVAALAHALAASRVARRILWVLAVFLVVFSVLSAFSVGLVALPSGGLLLLAALASSFVRTPTAARA